MKNTSQEYDNVIAICRSLFINKMTDYGGAWRILRLPSLTDQIFKKHKEYAVYRKMSSKSKRRRNRRIHRDHQLFDNGFNPIELGVADQPDLDVERQLNYLMLKSN
jgi:hypothetical protein